ncbi:MAG: hypothetical protein LBJ67_10595 [Planctomycetaceae bacterium]|nr:hypothetical protein [Planctomycetaceae bacterium]
MAPSNPRRAILTQPIIREHHPVLLVHLAPIAEVHVRHVGDHRPATHRATLQHTTQAQVLTEALRRLAQLADKPARLAEEHLVPVFIPHPEVLHPVRLVVKRMVLHIRDRVPRRIRRHLQPPVRLAGQRPALAFIGVE